MKFSERLGITQVKNEIQIDGINDDLRNGLWNILNMFYIIPISESDSYDRVKSSHFIGFIEDLWFSFYKEPTDEIPFRISVLIKDFRKRFFNYSWFQTYDFLEYVVKNPGPIDNDSFISACDFILKRELSGYRFLNNELTPITDENQISQIQSAIDQTNKSNLQGINIHLQAALKKLSDKKAPDYRNSIKESISAVESICQIIAGDTKAELGKTLKIIKDKIGMHSALEQGFTKIYGYTSDGDGIRHSLTEEPNLDLEDAIYMLTSCSAFINYLMIKANKSGIELN